MRKKNITFQRSTNIMDKKPVKAALGLLTMGILGAKALRKASKKKSTANPNDMKYEGNDKPVTDLYQKATKQETAKMNTGGSVEVMKGGDYIKDLIK